QKHARRRQWPQKTQKDTKRMNKTRTRGGPSTAYFCFLFLFCVFLCFLWLFSTPAAPPGAGVLAFCPGAVADISSNDDAKVANLGAQAAAGDAQDAGRLHLVTAGMLQHARHQEAVQPAQGLLVKVLAAPAQLILDELFQVARRPRFRGRAAG